MPAKQRVYKIDVRELADMVALATVTEEKEVVTLITDFTEFMSIPLDKDLIASQTKTYQMVAERLTKKKTK